MDALIELESLEIHVLIDNELDPISPSPNPSILQTGSMRDLPTPLPTPRGTANHELRMDSICCSAHGLSLLITGHGANGEKHTLLFDTGPEQHSFERNALRLKADLASVERIHLSHWHSDHSGGMLKALPLITAAKTTAGRSNEPVIVDLHPARPDYRGIMTPFGPVSLEADPSFAEIEAGGGVVEKNDQPHVVCGGMFGVSGHIPRVTGYERGLKRGVRYETASGEWIDDTEMADERFVVCKVKGKGMVLFTGCSHAGVVNATKAGVGLLGRETGVYAVVGGYHLADAKPELLEPTIRDLMELKPKVLLAGHCTGWRAKFAIERAFGAGVLVPSFVGSKFTL